MPVRRKAVLRYQRHSRRATCANDYRTLQPKPKLLPPHSYAPKPRRTICQQCQALQHDLKQCSAATQKLLQENQRPRSIPPTGKAAAAGTKRTDYHPHRAWPAGTAPAELSRDDVELARRLELTDLPSDTTQALIRIVAVLAQRDNLERLWAALKDRARKPPLAHTAERALPLRRPWYNHNWRSKFINWLKSRLAWPTTLFSPSAQPAHHQRRKNQ